tara:strand:- start:135 stop:371 length:237 start_codon:yes stop_codon:yes gene_type:complete
MGNVTVWKGAEYDARHGGAFDRGSADAYYRRPREPHYYIGGTGNTPKVQEYQMTEEQISAYYAGYSWGIDQGDFKDWG